MLNIMSACNNLGYGNVGYNIVKESYLLDNRTAFCPIGQPSRISPEIQAAARNIQFLNKKFPCLRIWHQHDMSQWLSFPTIGFPIFELDKFTDVEKHQLSIPDRLFVCSEWAKSIVEKEVKGVGRVDVVNLGFDPTIFFPLVNPIKKDKVVFLNCGKWEVRKGHDVLYRIFNTAFKQEDNVELWMLTNNPFLTKEEDLQWKSLYLNSPLGNKIKFIPPLENHEQVANIMRMADYGIFPSRAEGWNLEALEMIACGKEVIITDYSAHKEYILPQNSTKIEISETEPAYDGKWFFGQGNWAKFSEETINNFAFEMLIKYKRHKRNEKEVSSTVSHMTWKNTVNKIKEII